MCSRLLKAIIIAAALAFTACVRVGEDAPPTPEINAGLDVDMACFANTAKDLESFIKGTATDYQLQEFWNCNMKAVIEFEKNTHGNLQDRYKARELANFIERNFLNKDVEREEDKVGISDEMMRQILLLKRIFVGGDSATITRKEMLKSIDVMKELKRISLKLNPHMKVYSFNWQAAGLSFAERLMIFADAEKAIQTAAEEISPLMIESYDLREMIVLAEEIDGFGKGAPRTTFSKMAKQLIPVLIAVKNIIFKDQGSVVSQWKDFLGLSSQGYARYGYFDYFVKSEDVMAGNGLAALNNFVQDTLGFLDSVLDRKNINGIISLTEINSLWKAMIKAELFPAKVTVEALDSVTKAMVQKIFLDPLVRTMSGSPDGLIKGNTKVIRKEFAIWYETQMWLDAQFAASGPVISQDAMYAAVKAALPTQGLNELSILVQTPEALSFDANNRLYLGKFARPHTRKSVNLLNVSRTAVRLGMRGYAKDFPRARDLTGLTEAEAETIFRDIRALVVQLDLIDPNDEKFALDRFRDANLFTPFANGNEMLSFGEGADLFLMLASGIKIDAAYKKVLESTCPVQARGSFKGDSLVEVECALRVYKAHLVGESMTLPELLKWLGTLDSNDYDKAVFGLMRGAGYPGEKNGKVKLSTLGQFPQVTQYVEQIFHRFDSNKDGYFSTEEALNAYPVFQKIITKFSGLKTEQENRAVYGYMLTHAHPPETLVDKLWFATTWVNKPTSDWNLQADRQKVIEILAYIAKKTANPIHIQ